MESLISTRKGKFQDVLDLQNVTLAVTPYGIINKTHVRLIILKRYNIRLF